MGKKKEQMSDEERAAVLERMTELRKMAIEKRKALASQHEEVKEKKKLVQEEKLEARKALLERDKAVAEKLKKLAVKKDKVIKALDETIGESGETDPVSIAKPKDPLPEYVPPEITAEKSRTVYKPEIDPYTGFGGIGQMMLFESFRREIKNQYKQKYKEKYSKPTPLPVAPVEDVRSPVADTAKEQLKAKIDAEIKQMAYQSLFGKAF